jgi:hypothetical protein
MAPRCITCDRPLKPGTSVPRWDESTVEMHRKFYDEQVAKRKAELENGEVGYLGEAQFCNVQCAAIFGRASVHYFKAMSFIPDAYHERIQQMQKLMLHLYKWVADRKAGKG